MSARTCADGSSCVVTQDGPSLVTVSRYVDGRCVWGQVFSGSTASHVDDLMSPIVAEMVAHPERFDRSQESPAVAHVLGTAGDEGRVLAWQVTCPTCGDIGHVVTQLTTAAGGAAVHNGAVHDFHGPVRVDADGWDEA